MGWYSDEDLLANIVAQTAEFRYRICWAGADGSWNGAASTRCGASCWAVIRATT